MIIYGICVLLIIILIYATSKPTTLKTNIEIVIIILIADLFLRYMQNPASFSIYYGGNVPSQQQQRFDTHGHVFKDSYYLIPDFYQKAVENMGPEFELPATHLMPDAIDSGEFVHRELLDTHPAEPYNDKTVKANLLVHWGQLKLMLTEIEFITLVYKRYNEINCNRPIHLVYAGAAPGNHINFLHRMFPLVYFHLYDPNEFSCSETSMIKTHVQWFTNEVAEQWSSSRHPDKFIVFVSDIRTFPANQQNIAANMRDQRKWWEIMQPELSMFKFRLPWDDGITEYMAGNILIQAFAPLTSTETRLIVYKDAPITTYSNKKYDQQMAYHNAKSRGKKYIMPVPVDDQSIDTYHLDSCYDCAAFAHIIEQYKVIMGSDKSIKELITLVENNTVKYLNLPIETRSSHEKRIAQMRKSALVKCAQGCKYCKPIIADEDNEIAANSEFNARRQHGHNTYQSITSAQ